MVRSLTIPLSRCRSTSVKKQCSGNQHNANYRRNDRYEVTQVDTEQLIKVSVIEHRTRILLLTFNNLLYAPILSKRIWIIASAIP